ncbi:hypothetical protein KHA80_16145 [Anaerobacillus sp. HL2]|nr:hypothetical protein KHA80_16145 [Anaerobacillus sp. HL2]
MGKWIMLSVVGVLCLSVWTFVAVSFFSAQETIYPEQTTARNGKCK